MTKRYDLLTGGRMLPLTRNRIKQAALLHHEGAGLSTVPYHRIRRVCVVMQTDCARVLVRTGYVPSSVGMILWGDAHWVRGVMSMSELQ